MKLIYNEPEINIRKYDFPANSLFTTPSGGGTDLGDGDGYGELSNGLNRSIFAE